MTPLVMASIGFDLDETLGKFSVSEYHTYFLQPHNALYRCQWSGKYGTHRVSEPALSEALVSKLNTAFDLFVDCLAEKEKEGLGLIRPGIVEIAKRLYELKQTGQVKSVVIYSNNGNLSALHLAGKLIERLANAPGLFCNYLHWYHPSRQSEIVYGRPGSARKTMQVLLEAFQTGACSTNEIDLDQVYFFDDTLHPDIADSIGNRYFQNPAYGYDADPAVLNECFLRAFEASGLGEDPEYFTYMAPVLQGNKSLDAIMNLIKADGKRFQRKTIKPNNTNFRTRFHETFPPPPIRHNVFIKALQTTRRFEGKLNVGAVLTPEQQTALNTARELISRYESENPTAGGKRNRKTKKQIRRSKN
jgi:hypothetical protein